MKMTGMRKGKNMMMMKGRREYGGRRRKENKKFSQNLVFMVFM